MCIRRRFRDMGCMAEVKRIGFNRKKKIASVFQPVVEHLDAAVVPKPDNYGHHHQQHQKDLHQEQCPGISVGK